ncbi:MAG: hypothetical protein AAF968_27655, partial [Pseudomonadota bacterium]
AAVKRACIETFFRYRARAELSAEKWSEVVCDDVELWQPITPHRNFRPAEIVGTRRLSKGVDAFGSAAGRKGLRQPCTSAEQSAAS